VCELIHTTVPTTTKGDPPSVGICTHRAQSIKRAGLLCNLHFLQREFPQEPKMPKRKSDLMSHYRSKRFKPSKGRVEKIARPNQFINQLGGWSSNPGNRRTRDVLRPITTTRFTTVITNQSSRGTVSFNMSTIPDSIRDVYQRVRIKKVTLFAVLDPRAPSGENGTRGSLQVSFAKATQIDPDIDPRNVPGAQVKLLLNTYTDSVQLGDVDGISNVIRISRMYPPIEVDTSGTVGGAPMTKENYLSTANPSGMWTCFCYDFAGLTGQQQIEMTHYFTVELLCNTMKA